MTTDVYRVRRRERGRQISNTERFLGHHDCHLETVTSQIIELGGRATPRSGRIDYKLE